MLLPQSAQLSYFFTPYGGTISLMAALTLGYCVLRKVSSSPISKLCVFVECKLSAHIKQNLRQINFNPEKAKMYNKLR